MVVSQIKGQIRLMKKYEDSPQFIILHVAGNDLGWKKSVLFAQQKEIEKEIKNKKLNK